MQNMIYIDTLQLVAQERNRITATFTVANDFATEGEWQTIYLQKQPNDKYNISIDNIAPIFHIEIERKEVMQIVAQAIIRVYRFRFSKYVFFKQEYIRKNTPQFMLKLGAKPKTQKAKKFIEWLEIEFSYGEMIGIDSLQTIERCIQLYVKMEYGKVAPPYIQLMRNYQWHWCNVKVPEGEKSYAEWAEKSMYIFENQSTCTKSGPTLATIVPIIMPEQTEQNGKK